MKKFNYCIIQNHFNEMHSLQRLLNSLFNPKSSLHSYIILSCRSSLGKKKLEDFTRLFLIKKEIPFNPSTPIKRGANEVKPRFRARNLSETKRCHIQSYCPEIFANTLVPPFTFIFLRFLPFTRPIILSLNGGERRGTLSA